MRLTINGEDKDVSEAGTMSVTRLVGELGLARLLVYAASFALNMGG